MDSNRKHSGRQANYELLRIIAMIMVVAMHYLNYADALPVLGEDLSARRVLGTLIESVSIVAVNLYVLISGYFLVDAEYKISRLLKLLAQILFYSAGIPIFLSLIGAGDMVWGEGIYSLLKYVFPLQSELYWFATAYVVMYLFAPLLNAGVRIISKKQFQAVLAGLVLFFSVGKSLIPFQLSFDRFGYDFGWFLFVYLAAAYLKLYGSTFFPTGKKAWFVYSACSAACFCLVIGIHWIYGKTAALEYYFSVPFHYNYIVCLIAAVALFCAFGFLHIPEGNLKRAILKLSPLTFGVYLLHEHTAFRLLWTQRLREMIGFEERFGVMGFIPELLICVAIVFAAGIMADAVRRVIFDYVERKFSKK